MAPLDKVLRRAGYQTAVPLIAGHGAGHKELLATTWEDWREGLRSDLRKLAETCDEVVIAGLCVGGLLGAVLAAEEEKVRGFVSLAPDLNFRVPGPMMPWTRFLLPAALRVPWLRRHGYWAQKPPYGIKNPRLQQRIAKAVAASTQGQTQEYGTFRTYVGTIRELNRLRNEVMRILGNIKCPVLMVHSFEDSMFSIRNVTVMYSQLGSSRKEVSLITGCDHVLTVDLRRDEVAARILNFIGGQPVVSPENKQDSGFLACEIAPDYEASAADDRKIHHLVVRRGPVARLTLSLTETESFSRPQFKPDPGALRIEPADDNGSLQAQWQLARAAMDALSFGLEKRLTPQTGLEADEPVSSGASPNRFSAIPVF